MDCKEFEANIQSTLSQYKVIDVALNLFNDVLNPDACQFLTKVLAHSPEEDQVTMILSKLFELATNKDMELLYLDFYQEKAFFEALIQQVGSLELGPIPNAQKGFEKIMTAFENKLRIPQSLLKLSLTVADSMLGPESQEVRFIRS
jgi:hypothetical protein